jgi:hypothetical protein
MDMAAAAARFLQVPWSLPPLSLPSLQPTPVSLVLRYSRAQSGCPSRLGLVCLLGFSLFPACCLGPVLTTAVPVYSDQQLVCSPDVSP